MVGLGPYSDVVFKPKQWTVMGLVINMDMARLRARVRVGMRARVLCPVGWDWPASVYLPYVVNEGFSPYAKDQGYCSPHVDSNH